MKLQMRTVQYFFNLVTSCYLKYQRKPKILKYIQFKVIPWKYLDKENRIYIRVKFTGKKCKTAILFYCFHTAGVLHIYLCFITFWAREHYFIENLKLILKINQIMKQAGFIIDQLDSMPFTLQTMIFRYNYKSNDVFFSHLIHCKVYSTALNNSKLKWIVQGTYCINVLYCI